MKRVKAKPITELIPQFLREECLETPLLEYRLTHKGWHEIVGDTIALHTTKLTIFNQTLYIECNSAVVRQELMMRRTELTYKLNKYVDAYIIKNIVVR